jgi:monoamine oxidase
VLEQTARIGGRIKTVRRHGLDCDLGAAWIHGESSENPLVELAAQFNIEREGGCTGNPWMEPEHMLQSGLCLKPESITKEDMTEGIRVLQEIMAEVQVHAQQCGDDWDIKLGPTLQAVLARKPGRDTPALQFYLRLVGFWMAGDVDDLCLAEFAEGYGGRYGDFDGAHTKVKGGMQRFIDHMSIGLTERIQRQAAVTGIEYSGKGCSIRGLVTNASGKQEQRTWSASHVIVTVPIGVLKAGAIVFKPPLPRNKQRAINALGSGAYKKIYMEFREVFWGSEEEGGEPLFFGSHLEGTPLLMNCHRRRPCCSCKKGENEAPAVLEATVCGPAAEKLIGRSDEEVVSQMLGEVQRMFCLAELPPLVGATVTRWEEEPASLCAYSYMVAGSSDDDVEALAAPLAGRLFFCGEATDAAYQGSAFAALLSARRVLDELQSCIGSHWQ